MKGELEKAYLAGFFEGEGCIWISRSGKYYQLQIAVVHLSFLQEAFATASLDAVEWLMCLGLGSTILFVDEARKLWVGRSGSSRR